MLLFSGIHLNYNDTSEHIELHSLYQVNLTAMHSDCQEIQWDQSIQHDFIVHWDIS